MKTGRNDPCPCGSGKKYKKCCLSKTAVPSQALYYRRLSETHDRLVERLLAYAERTLGEEAFYVAMDEFLLYSEPEDEIAEEQLLRLDPLFWPWYLFNWEYDEIDAEVKLPMPEDRTVVELYAAARAGKLDPLESRLIESINRKPYSFWEVLSVDTGKGMTVKDIFIGDRIEVHERSGSEYVQPGDVLFGRAVVVDGVGMFIGLAQTIIPPGRKPDIIQLRKLIQRDGTVITDDTLYDWDMTIRELYFNIDRSLHAMPEMRNTDDQPLEFHRLIYEVSGTEKAFDKLCGLCVTMTPEELRANGERDNTGDMVRIEFPWDRRGQKKISELPNTVLGRIQIDGRRLTAEVNSAKRATALRREIDARLGNDGRFKVDEIQDFDSMMERHADGTMEAFETKEHEDLMQYPEVREQIAQMIGKHWESWVDQEIPALGGKSPRDAVRTSDGREAVEALLKDAESDRGRDPLTAEINRQGAQEVRIVLGLDYMARDDGE